MRDVFPEPTSSFICLSFHLLPVIPFRLRGSCPLSSWFLR